MHANDFVIQFIVTAGCGQERVSVRDEQVENIHNLNGKIFGNVDVTFSNVLSDLDDRPSVFTILNARKR